MRRFLIKYGMLIILTVLLAAAGWGLVYAMYEKPGPTVVDCRGLNIEVETLRQWEEQEKEGYLGLVGVAGWRVENQKEVTVVATGKSLHTRVTGIYGPMSMVYPANIVSGAYGYAFGREYCVLSESLAYELFGTTDVENELVRYDGTILTVAGVIDKKEKYLLVPVTEGKVEQLSLQFKSRRNVEEKVKELLGGV